MRRRRWRVAWSGCGRRTASKLIERTNWKGWRWDVGLWHDWLHNSVTLVNCGHPLLNGVIWITVEMRLIGWLIGRRLLRNLCITIRTRFFDWFVWILQTWRVGRSSRSGGNRHGLCCHCGWFHFFLHSAERFFECGIRLGFRRRRIRFVHLIAMLVFIGTTPHFVIHIGRIGIHTGRSFGRVCMRLLLLSVSEPIIQLHDVLGIELILNGITLGCRFRMLVRLKVVWLNAVEQGRGCGKGFAFLTEIKLHLERRVGTTAGTIDLIGRPGQKVLAQQRLTAAGTLETSSVRMPEQSIMSNFAHFAADQTTAFGTRFTKLLIITTQTEWMLPIHSACIPTDLLFRSSHTFVRSFFKTGAAATASVCRRRVGSIFETGRLPSSIGSQSIRRLFRRNFGHHILTATQRMLATKTAEMFYMPDTPFRFGTLFVKDEPFT